MTQAQIIETIRTSLRAAGFNPDEERFQAVTGNIAQVWCGEVDWQLRRERLFRQLAGTIRALDRTTINPLAMPSAVLYTLNTAYKTVVEIDRLDAIDAELT